ncbi:hypothetical protein ABID21_004093 [Pseudorhizobium tarimense]|uniref:Uncharacterized protein n=1 Tax=Pseudorhizobium tarimense TaxID=1079109 RepID=A0ABV2HBM8_9HYPH
MASVEPLALHISAVQRRTFSDPIPNIASPYARRTARVTKIVALLVTAQADVRESA